MREVAILECDHRVIRETGDIDTHEFCRVCQLTALVIKTEPWFDQEAV